MINTLKILKHQGQQFIKDVTKVKLKEPFRGRPIISTVKVDEYELLNFVLSEPLKLNPFRSILENVLSVMSVQLSSRTK